MTDLGTFGWWGSSATGINEGGQIAGWVSKPSGASYAFLSSSGGITLLGAIEGATRIADGLNDRGQVVGWDQIGLDGGDRAFLWQDGTTVDLRAFGGLTAGLRHQRLWPGRRLERCGAVSRACRPLGDRHAVNESTRCTRRGALTARHPAAHSSRTREALTGGCHGGPGNRAGPKATRPRLWRFFSAR